MQLIALLTEAEPEAEGELDATMAVGLVGQWVTEGEKWLF